MHDAYQNITRTDEVTFNLSGNNAVSLEDATKAIRAHLRFREFKWPKGKKPSGPPANHYYTDSYFTYLDESRKKQKPEALLPSLIGRLNPFHVIPPQRGGFTLFPQLPPELQDMIWVEAAGSKSWQTRADWNSLEPQPGRSAVDLVIQLEPDDVRTMWASPLFRACKRSREIALRLWGTPSPHTIPFDPSSDYVEIDLRCPPFLYSPRGLRWLPPGPQCERCGNTRPRDASNNPTDIPLTFCSSDSFRALHRLFDHRTTGHRASGGFRARVRQVRLFIPRSTHDDRLNHPENWNRFRGVNWYDQVLAHLVLYFPRLATLEISLEKRWDDMVERVFPVAGHENVTRDYDAYDFRALGLLEAVERLPENPILDGKYAERAGLRRLVFNMWGARGPEDKPGAGTVGQGQTWNFSEVWSAHIVLFVKGEEEPRTGRGTYRLP